MTALQLELSNIDEVYDSSESTITSAIKLLQTNQPQQPDRQKRSLLPFLGDALSWLTGTATTKDIRSIKTRINQLISTQTSQHDTLAHIISILNVTRYATQSNRRGINSLIDAVRTTSYNIDNLYNLTSSLASSINFHQLILQLRSVFANLRDALHHIRMVSAHTMDYIDAATTGTLSPRILPVKDLQGMLQHIADSLPSTLRLPVSPDDTLHFYRYLRTHVLIENKQFLLLIDVPIQDRSRQISIYQVISINIPHGNYSAQYDVSTQFLGISHDATMAVELSPRQYKICKEANGQFCSITSPYQPLAKPPSCITALYTKSLSDITTHCSVKITKALETSLPTQIAPDVWLITTPAKAQPATTTLICPASPMETINLRKPLHILKLPTACSATSPTFYLPPRYETSALDVNVSLQMANLHYINMSDQHFRIWNHLGTNRTEDQLHHLSTISSIPINSLYQHLLNNTGTIQPFDMTTGSSREANPLWTLLTHPGVYATAIGSLIPLGIGFLCCYLFWCRPAKLARRPLTLGNTQYAIVDDNVVEAPIYRREGKAPQPTRPRENHGLAIEHLPTRPESRHKQQSQSLGVPTKGSLGISPKIKGTQ